MGGVTPTVSDEVVAAVHLHAAEEAPRECCGLISVRKGRARYTPCRNVSAEETHFEIAPADFAAVEDQGEIIAIAHSHYALPPTPSMADRVGCEASGLPWLIVGHPGGKAEWLLPEGYQAPLVNREWCHGVLDCYSLVRDYYARELAIALPDFERPHEWWFAGADLYREHYREAGFVLLPQDAPLALHDCLGMQIASPVWNHTGVLVDDNAVLHHLEGRLSSRDVYGGYYRDHTVAVARHRELL